MLHVTMLDDSSLKSKQETVKGEYVYIHTHTHTHLYIGSR